MTRKINVGVVGATGLVGEVFLKLLAERQFPIDRLRLYASERSKGATRTFNDQILEVETLKEDCFKGLDLVFFSSGEDISREWAPRAVAQGAFAVDNSSAFRMDPSKQLCVPEINGHLLPKPGTPALIANPNCSTIQLVMALHPLLKNFGIESVHVATYQAVSGAGLAGQEELRRQLKAWVQDDNLPSPETFPHTIAMNCIPQIGSFTDSGFCTEENKIMGESKKILADSSLRLSAFTVRVPAWNAHSEAVWVRLKQKPDRQAVLQALHAQDGLVVDETADTYPVALKFDDQNPVAVGRLHQDLEDPQTWLMWIVSDNLRKGAALNGLQIAERIFDISPAP